jgi:hypothetical protein
MSTGEKQGRKFIIFVVEKHLSDSRFLRLRF